MRNTQINVFAQTLRVLKGIKNEQRQKADEKAQRITVRNITFKSKLNLYTP